MHDLVIVGSVFFEVFIPPIEWPEMGTEMIVDRIHVGLGGALNGASVARGLGLDVALVSPRGDGLTDRAIASEITRMGIRAINWSALDDGAITLVRSTSEDRSFVTAVDRTSLSGCPELPPSRFVHVGGLPEAEGFAGRLAEARARGARISVSAGHDPPRLAALAEYRGPPPWDVFFCNDDEARALGATRPADLVGRLAESVIITRGPDGVDASFDGASFTLPAVRVDVVDPTGAGDALAAGVLAGLVRELSPERALDLGLRTAARALSTRGGVLPTSALADLRVGA